jgi:hypothetical protein
MTQSALTAIPSRKAADMKVLFTLKSQLAAKKSLKSHAWYIWY